jgi:hypothetical protein
MSGFQLTASLVSSLAWPLITISILFLIWAKRRDIGVLLSLHSTPQGRTVRRLRAGPVEVEWDQLIATTAEQVPDIPASEPSAEKSSREELAKIADSVPTAAVLEAYARLEGRLRELQAQEDPVLTSRPVAIHQVLAALVRSGSISGEVNLAVRNLNHLKNEAAHRVGAADITTEQAYEYLELVERVLDYLNTISPPTSKARGAR